jgi:hypothetical protein
MNPEDERREFLLQALRIVSMRSKAFQMEIDNVGVALKAKMMTPEQVARWMIAEGFFDSLGIMPEAIANPSTKQK